MIKLQHHKNNDTKSNSVFVGHTIENGNFCLKGEVKSENKPNTSDDFSQTSYENWNLWNHDVVELFITGSKNITPYLEFQLSPKEQIFAQIIEVPREKFYYPKSFEAQTKVELKEDGWAFEAKISLKYIPNLDKEIFANVTACLGPQDAREYLGIQINDDEAPDYHKKELFKKVATLKESFYE